MREYDLIADWYASERVTHTGVPESDRARSFHCNRRARSRYRLREDTMNGVVFRYFSFNVDGYRRMLREHDLTLDNFHPHANLSVASSL